MEIALFSFRVTANRVVAARMKFHRRENQMLYFKLNMALSNRGVQQSKALHPTGILPTGAQVGSSWYYDIVHQSIDTKCDRI